MTGSRETVTVPKAFFVMLTGIVLGLMLGAAIAVTAVMGGQFAPLIPLASIVIVAFLGATWG